MDMYSVLFGISVFGWVNVCVFGSMCVCVPLHMHVCPVDSKTSAKSLKIIVVLNSIYAP